MSEEKIPTLSEAVAEAEKNAPHVEQPPAAEPPQVIEGAPPVLAPNAPKPQFLIKYTLDGEVLVEKRDKEVFVHPLKDVELMPLPPNFNEGHMAEMKIFHSLVRTIKKQHPKRVVPVTRKELYRAGASPKIIEQLCEMGLLRKDLIDFINPQGKSTGARLCFFYTPQGRALIRAKLDPNYAKTGYN